MKVTVVGGLGFVGQNIISALIKKNYEITCIDMVSLQTKTSQYEYICADTTTKGDWQQHIYQADAVINLAGATIFNIWTKKYKTLIYDSRILTTNNIVEAIDEKKETILLSTSAAGYYGNRNNDFLTEQEPPGNDFLANVCINWEKQANKAKEKNTRVCIMRFGIVLGQKGALAQMIPMAKKMINPVLGSGKNYFPWIHIHDLTNAALFLLENNELYGPFNFTSPGFITQKEFTFAIAKQLDKPAFLFIPEFLIRMFGGDLGKSFLCSQKADPKKLMENNFNFQFENASKALSDII